MLEPLGTRFSWPRLVDVCRVNQTGFFDSCRAIGGDGAEKATGITFVAGRTDLIDLQQDGVRVAVHLDFANGLLVTAGLAFSPQLSSRAAEVDGAAGLHRFVVRGLIHPGHHQNPSAGGVLSDRRQQSIPAGFAGNACREVGRS